MIENVLSLCSEKLKSKQVQFKVDPIPDLLIECRAIQVEQVLLNLLNNAHDAVIELSDKWIQIGFASDYHSVVISITDSGSGIPPAIAEKMMQPFFTTKVVGQGTGLGLSISVGIIEAHSGRLKYDAKSVNTCFRVELPFKQPVKN